MCSFANLSVNRKDNLGKNKAKRKHRKHIKMVNYAATLATKVAVYFLIANDFARKYIDV